MLCFFRFELCSADLPGQHSRGRIFHRTSEIGPLELLVDVLLYSRPT